jgi:uncharacterized caspase-like protein
MGLWRCALILALVLAAPIARADPVAQKLAAANAEPQRIALVIGNADYNQDGRTDTPPEVSDAAGYVSDLANPVNDANSMRDALTRLHFKVTYLANGNREQMELALANFGAEVARTGPNDIVVIYYSGHGMQVDGVNYLIPVGAKIPMGQDLSGMPPESARTVIANYTVSMDDIFAQLRRPAEHGLNLIILDACRDNPWETRLYGGRGSNIQAGLAQAQTALPRTLIAFATSPGHLASDGKGQHSPYTAALLTWIEAPDMDVLHMLNRVGLDVDKMTGQTPWMNNAPVAEICLAGCSDGASQSRSAVARLNASVDAGHDQGDESAFREAVSKATVEDLQAYVASHPGSPNAAAANSLIIVLRAKPTNKK